jgi:hypothetical protein|tara:strand:- start:5347 stop:5592 length:246 start_codon:yes stop_codon:yes gene_type:complete
MTVITKERSQIRPGTQNYMILQHLRLGNSLTGIEALHLFKVRDLPKRVSELNEYQGDFVRSEWKIDTTGSRYKRYWMDLSK